MKNIKLLAFSVLIPFVFTVSYNTLGMESISPSDEMPRIYCLWNLEPKKVVYRAAALGILEKKTSQEPFQKDYKLRITYLKKLGKFLKENPCYPLELEILKSDGENRPKVSNFYDLTVNYIKSAFFPKGEGEFALLKAKTFYSHILEAIIKFDHAKHFEEIMEFYRVLESESSPILKWKLRCFYNSHIKSSVDVDSLIRIEQQVSRAAMVTKKPEEAELLSCLVAKITFKLGRIISCENISQQYSYYLQSSHLGHSLATYYLAELLNTEKYSEAYEYYLDSANDPEQSNPFSYKQSNPFSCYKMAKIFENGDTRLSIASNKEGAQKWHERAAAQGHPYSQYELAIEFMGNQREEEGIALLQKSAESGYVEAQLCLAQKYEEGYGDIPKDIKLARFWYEKAVVQEEGQKAYYPLGALYEEETDFGKAIFFYEKSEDARAYVRLGKMHLEGKGKVRCELLAAEWFGKAAVQGNADGNYYLGLIKLKGQGYGERRLKDAFNNFTAAAQPAAAQHNHPEALLQLGIMKQFGLGTNRNLDKARKFYEEAGQQGIAGALYYLGILYNLEHKVHEALIVWEKAAKSGHSDSCYKAGKSYLKEWLKKNDKETAAKAESYLKQAGDEHVDALYLIGVMQENGIGHGKNLSEAIKYYGQAASKGHAPAQFKLGNLHEAEDKAQAFDYYNQAADQGHIGARLALGRLYQRGEGTSKDLNQAFSCFKSLDKEIGRSLLSSMKSLAAEGHGEAITWFQGKASEENADAQRYLGKILEMGVFLPQNMPKAIKFYQQASQNGKRSAQRRLDDFKKSLVFEAVVVK